MTETTNPTRTAGLAVPDQLTVDASLSAEDAAATVHAAQALYGFWASGEETLLADAIDDRFIDHTLPPGRPQGPDGPRVASRAFRAAVPDLTCAVEEFLVIADRVTARLHFTGTFTGAFRESRAPASRSTSSPSTCCGSSAVGSPTTGISRTI